MGKRVVELMGAGKEIPPHDMPVMGAKCRTCPFGENGDKAVREAVIGRLMGASQHCHSSGWPVGTHLCRGARDWQLKVMHRVGVIEEPTDGAWDRKCRELLADRGKN